MCKALDKGMEITDIILLEKDWREERRTSTGEKAAPRRGAMSSEAGTKP